MSMEPLTEMRSFKIADPALRKQIEDFYKDVSRRINWALANLVTGTQQAHLADPAGGGTVDAEARTAINSIIDSLEAFGINATS